ncbi:MAG: sulfate adenylyltransferase subunit CysN [Candidatus Brocadiia bacterium]|jgi:bifunctional enzyme CysN/CysC
MDLDRLLRQYEQTELLRFTTVGSVDDGKSTLIGRLLYESESLYQDHISSVRKASEKKGTEIDFSFFTDGLKAEREQGITIDVAYRCFATARRRFIIADVPGHEQYTRNMVTGASTAQLAVILIDAQKGILQQSKRHAFIASLLGVQHVVAAVNKMDLVGYDRSVFDRICDDFRAFAPKLALKDIVFIPLSALAGDNVVERSANMPWYDGTTLLNHLETVLIAGDQNLIDFRFPVQYVLRPDANFRGYAGQIVGGVARVGDEVAVLPSGLHSRITRIVTRDGDLPYAFPPMSVTFCLEHDRDISRGDMLVHPANRPRMDQRIEAMLVWMDTRPLQVGRAYQLKHTTRVLPAHVASLHYRIDPNDLHRQVAPDLGLNEIGRVEIETHQPLMYDEYARNRRTGGFILIDPQTNGTVGAGMIIERALHRSATAGAEERAPVSRNIVAHNGQVATADRARLLGQKAVTLWMTGLSGSGKSSLAYALEKRLFDDGRLCYVIDGDNVRHGLNRDLGFAPEDRAENLRRVAEVARLFNDAGVIVITSFISPYERNREDARRIIGAERFIEVFVDAPIAVCEERDPKGLYRKARAGEIADFTGLSASYEAPAAPDIHLPTSQWSFDVCVDHLRAQLAERGIC